MPYKTSEQRRAARRRYYQRNTEKEKSRMAEWRSRNPERHALLTKASRLRAYGITIEQFQAMLTA